jgi:DNA-binding MarR family transcriptional regulator/GNAT superfamily N-acetyltransferase
MVPTTAGEVSRALSLDLGYLSRIVRSFASRGLISRRRSRLDGRRIHLSLTAKGRGALADLEARSRDQISSILKSLSTPKRAKFLASIRDVQTILTEPRGEVAPHDVVIRTHRIGDVGWAIERHGRIYADEYGWNEEFEALVAKLFARFANEHDCTTERFWVAELDGERAGCVFVVHNDEDPTVAQLRCLLVEPSARGHGIGRRLVDACVAFARSAGYRRMILWTNDVLVSARIYGRRVRS